MVRRMVIGLAAVGVLCGGAVGVFYLLKPAPPAASGEVPVHRDAGGQLPTADAFEALARTDPVRMLDAALTRYRREVRDGFTATLVKQEVVAGTAYPEEEIRLAAWDEFGPDPAVPPTPHVRMVWVRGFRQGGTRFRKVDIRAALLEAGPTDKKGKPTYQVVSYRPGAIVPTYPVAADDPDAREASRYCMTDAGLYRGMLRTHATWAALQKAGRLDWGYVSRRPVAEVGGRQCHEIRRTCREPEADAFVLGGDPPTDPAVVKRDGFTDVTIFVDAERWLQVGTELRNGDRVVGRYYYRDVVLNAQHPPGTFTQEGMRAAAGR